MKKFFLALLLPLILAGSFVTASEIVFPQQAEAARFGGGRSFGGRPAFQRPAQQPLKSPAQQNLNRSAGTAGAAQTRGGFLGPLLAGSMLGALFFGGAFSGMGMVDILVIFMGVYLLTRFLRSRRQAAEAQSGNGVSGRQDSGSGFSRSGSAANDPWARMRSAGQGAAPGNAGSSAQNASGIHTPEGFDLEEFLSGAKMMFTRLQESWDKRDLSDIEGFSSAAIVEEIRRQAEEDPTPSRTDIMMINAALTDFDEGNQSDTASVHFNVLLREYAGQDVHEVDEVWHFTRTKNGTWKLDGIQQVAS